MGQMSERINKPISTEELERRWAAIRVAMEEQGVDVLLMQNNNDHMGGYTKYVTDIPATNGYPVTIVFPRDDAMTQVNQGPFDMVKDLDVNGSDGVHRGVKTLMTTPSYACAPFTREYDPMLACKALEPYKDGTIGLVGTYQMSFAMVDYVKRQFPKATYIEASDLVDQIKVIKSDEEINLIRGTAKQQVASMKAVINEIRPGMKDSDVAAVALHAGHDLGSEQGVYLCQSWQIGSPTAIGPRHNQDRVIQEGDSFNMLVENNGAGGYFTEIGRTIVLGAATQEQHDELSFTLEAQRFTLDLMQPGTPCAEIWDKYNAFMVENDRDPEGRLYCHGQGYEMVERPLIRKDETMTIAKNMNLVCHPGYVRGNVYSWICDNYIIGSNGPGDSIHEMPQEIFEVG
ncbi:MAG TPA: M24 family metallopeptidase [Rhodospirillales bacterium]|nr:M24 family metallopeptidase [Rhodospirillales bacterium]HIL75948.1 M24 family metallopeptidase [Rhodospirillales bacterium]